jgi:hypothetical protein
MKTTTTTTGNEEMVVFEYMPECWRESHLAAGDGSGFGYGADVERSGP